MDPRLGKKPNRMAVSCSEDAGHNTTCQTRDGNGSEIWKPGAE